MSDILYLNALAEPYVGLLRGPHITELFDWIKDEVGEEEAANICGIDEDAANYRKDGYKEPDDETKKGMLIGLFKYNYAGTVEHLADISFGLFESALSSMLGSIHERAMDSDVDPDVFSELYGSFDRLFKKYSNGADRVIKEESGKLLFYLNQRREGAI